MSERVSYSELDDQQHFDAGGFQNDNGSEKIELGEPNLETLIDTEPTEDRGGEVSNAPDDNSGMSPDSLNAEMIGMCIEKFGGTEDDWTPNTEFSEFNIETIRDDGEIVDHTGESIIEAARKLPDAEESIYFQRLKESQQELKDTEGSPIITGDWERTVDGNRVLQVNFSVRIGNEIHKFNYDYLIEIAKTEKPEEEPEITEDDQEETEFYLNGQNVEDEGIEYVSVQIDGSLRIDITAALQAEELVKDTQTSETKADEEVTLEKEYVVKNIKPKLLVSSDIEISTLTKRESSPTEQVFFTDSPIIEAATQEVPEVILKGEIVMPEIPVSEIVVENAPTLVQVESTSREEALPEAQDVEIVARGNFQKSVETTLERIVMTPVLEKVDATSIQDTLPNEDLAQSMEKDLSSANDVSKSAPVITTAGSMRQARSIELDNQQLSIKNEDVPSTDDSGPDLPSQMVDQSIEALTEEVIVQDIVPEIVPSDGGGDMKDAVEIEPISFEESIASENIEPFFLKKDIQEKVVAELKPEAKIEEQITPQSIDLRERFNSSGEVSVFEFDAGSKAKESPFIVYENTLQLRNSEAKSTQNSGQGFMSETNMGSTRYVGRGVPANDILTDDRKLPARADVSEPVASENGITINMNEAA